MIEILAALSASSAAGLRIALPLLIIGLLQGEDLWSRVPILSQVPPPVVIGVLVSWSLLEVSISKRRLGQRALQIIQVIFSPIVGALMGMAIARVAAMSPWLVGLIGVVGGLLALVLQLVQIGWFYRLRKLPLWMIFAQDSLCIILVFFAFDAPRQGGLIALLLLWLAIRSSKEWRRWYAEQAHPRDRQQPRRHKQEPD
ncbi:DUF4126 domain-containing protein [Trichocoleus sp. FACHB-262]|uniref:DUF4126 domain-containing protein n=1 Tax=Trichocoleus sp. FACHB-262 TaxID=2692869 RepID=UPI00168410A8|nr:DUF4126 domain-containing protein [Trichocoleus sp. FACHB-262]MBD2123715.1 DUF4126 domain-containing protein [Trichocoleus sp. FACHB-262]